MFYCPALLLLAATADVFGYTLVGKSPQVGVVGGVQVPITAVPYMADLRWEDGYHRCAATIVHEQFVLTAAHCFRPNTTYVVAVGTDDVRGGDIYEIENTFPHEDYPSKIDHNICLVKLTKKITFRPEVHNIYLSAEPFQLVPDMPLNLTGWGRIAKEGDESRKLQQVTLPFMPQSECEKIKIYKGLITDNVICAGERDQGRGPCYADGGSPLVWNNIQLGISALGSVGAECGNMPSVYTKVSAFEKWIKDTINRNTDGDVHQTVVNENVYSIHS